MTGMGNNVIVSFVCKEKKKKTAADEYVKTSKSTAHAHSLAHGYNMTDADRERKGESETEFGVEGGGGRTE